MSIFIFMDTFPHAEAFVLDRDITTAVHNMDFDSRIAKHSYFRNNVIKMFFLAPPQLPPPNK